MPWKNKEYLDMAKELENKYVNVDMKDFNPFFDTIQQYKKTEEPNCTQQMYECLDTAIKSVLDNPDTANPDALLTTANSKFQTILDNEVNK